MRDAVIVARHEMLLQIVAHAVRFLTAELVMSLRPDVSSPATARRQLEKLRVAGYLGRLKRFGRRIPTIESPLYRWEPGAPPPEAGRISYLIRKRFASVESHQITLYVPTRRTLDLFGVDRPVILKRTQISHDLGVAQMFLFIHRHHPDWVGRWRGEDCYASSRGFGEKVEDAVILKTDSNEPELALEFLGASYGKKRLLALHNDFVQRGLPYLWF